MVTQFGQIVKPPKRLMIVPMNVSVSAAEIQYLSPVAELDNNDMNAENVVLALVRTGIGGGFDNSK
jgi:hypothetical protein